MHHQHHRRIARAFIKIMHAQPGAILRVDDLGIVRREREIADAGKGFVRCAKDFQATLRLATAALQRGIIGTGNAGFAGGGQCARRRSACCAQPHSASALNGTVVQVAGLDNTAQSEED